MRERLFGDFFCEESQKKVRMRAPRAPGQKRQVETILSLLNC